MSPAPKRVSPVPLIIFIVLFAFTACAFALVFVELRRANNQMNAGFDPNARDAKDYERTVGLKARLMERTAELGNCREELKHYKDITGTLNADTLEKELKEVAQHLNTPDVEKEINAFIERLRRIQDGHAEPGDREATNVMAFIQVLGKEKVMLLDQLEDTRKAAENQRKKFQEQLDAEAKKALAKDDAVKERDTEIDRLKRTLTEDTERTKKENTTLRDELKRRGDGLASLEAVKNEDIARLKHRIEELLRQIDELTGKGTKPGAEAKTAGLYPAPAGQVILVDKATGVVVDVGQKKGVRRGFRFQVYTEKADGTRLKRGEIEIKKVQPEISCGVLLDGSSPVEIIHRGDIVVNPVFHPGRAQVFVADTVFDAAKKQGFRDSLAEYGSILEDDVTARTDYIIVSAAAATAKSPLVTRAEKLGIVAIREDELNVFLGR